MVGFNFYHGEVGVFVEADYARVVFGGVAVESYLDFGGLVNYVIVGEDETFFVHDYAGAQAAFGVGAVVGLVEEAIEEILERVAEFFGCFAALGFFDYLGGGDGGEGVREHDGVGHGKERGAGGGLVVSGLRVAGN